MFVSPFPCFVSQRSWMYYVRGFSTAIAWSAWPQLSGQHWTRQPLSFLSPLASVSTSRSPPTLGRFSLPCILAARPFRSGPFRSRLVGLIGSFFLSPPTLVVCTKCRPCSSYICIYLHKWRAPSAHVRCLQSCDIPRAAAAAWPHQTNRREPWGNGSDTYKQMNWSMMYMYIL